MFAGLLFRPLYIMLGKRVGRNLCLCRLQVPTTSLLLHLLGVQAILARGKTSKERGLFALPTPINFAVLDCWLANYNLHWDVEVLRNGFSKGFSLCYTGPKVARDSECLPSASARPQVVVRKLAVEIALGRIAGPFRSRPFPNLQCSPIGLVPKREPNSFRLIHHLWFPAGQSINDFISGDLCAVHYASFDKAVELTIKAGRGASLWGVSLWGVVFPVPCLRNLAHFLHLLLSIFPGPPF